MKKSNLTKTLLAITLIAVMCFSFAALASCNAGCYINAPETLEAELGVYVVPDYDVVNSNGMIMSGFDVRLKSVTDANGKKVDFDQNSVTITEKGVYKFVYGAQGVKDATVSIDFADRTAPTVDFNANNLPSFFITGNSYRIPAYTLSGDYVREKCTVKVVHIASDKTEKEVEIKSNRFNVTETSGSYEIRIHVEDAVGNARDYAYARPVDGPEAIKENTIIYFDEPFGERQVYCLESGYTGQYVSNEVLGDKAREGDNGAYKVTFTGAETLNNEGYISLKTPAILDVNGYTELEMYVYNDSNSDAIFGATWWNDTTVKKGEWTRISFSVDNWGHCTWADNSTKIVSTNDISNMGLRFIFAYDHQTLPSGTFYLSPLRGVPRIPAEVTAGENVTLDKNSYSVGSVVKLTASEKTGQVVDCFLVDGKPIAGDSFVVTEEQHTVTVKYVDELTLDTMTWATGFHYPVPNKHWMTANSMGATYVGNSDKWVISTDVIGGYNEKTGGQTLNLSWMIGDTESIELQCSKDGGSVKWYFDGENWNVNIAKLTDEQFNKLKNASEQNPVNVTVMRNGDLILILIDGEFAGRCVINSVLSSNAFGIGYRKEGADKPDTVLLANTKAVIGGERTELFYAQDAFTSAVTKADDKVMLDKESYRLGEVVTLTAKAAEEGYLFGYFTVDGARIVGNSFIVKNGSYTVGAVYVATSKITFGDGVTAAEGDSVGMGLNLTLSHGEAPEAGKVFDYYLVDDTVKVYGNIFTVTAATHKIEAVWADAKDMTWGYVAANDETLKYQNTMGNDAAEWSSRGLDGYVFGQSEYWAIKAFVKHTTEWNSVEFIQGSKESIRIRFHNGGYLGVVLLQNGSETLPKGYDREGEFVVAFPHQNVEVVDKLKSGATITCVRYNDTITLYANDVAFFTTDYAVDHSGNWFGLGHIDAENATEPEMSNVQFVMGKDKVDAYIGKTWQTVAVNADENVILDKESYRQNHIVRLKAKDAPEGKMFSHFEVNGRSLDGDMFIATETVNTVAAVYVNASKLTLDENIKTSDGKTVYLLGATVTLTFDGTVPKDRYFNYFTVDGVKINGNTFVTSKAKHEVKAVFASSLSEMAWTEVEYKPLQGGDQKTLVLGNGTHWVLTYKLYGIPGSGWSYVGLYVGGEKFLGYELNGTAIKKFSGYGAPWVVGDGGWNDGVTLSDEVVAMLRGATESNPVTAIYVRQGDVFKAYLKDDSKLVWIATVTKSQLGLNTDVRFGLAERQGPTNATLKDVKFVDGAAKTEVYTETLVAAISKTQVTTDKDKYFIGDTVSLTADAAPAGKKFSHFEVDDVRISGNTFTVTKSAHKVVAVYDDISVIELGAGITTADGETEYVLGTTVTLVYDKASLNGKLFDYFTVDGHRILGDTFVTTAAKHVVAIVTADTVDGLTWVTSDEANEQTVKYEWSAYSFNGVSVGNSDYWVIEAEAYAFTALSNDWCSVEFLVGTSATIQIRLHPDLDGGGVQIAPMRKGIDDGKFLVKYQNGNGGGQTAKAVVDACLAATEAAPVTFTCVRNGNEFYVLFNGKMIVKTDFAFEITDNSFGIGETDCGTWLTNHPTYTYRYRTGEEITASKTASKVSGTNVTLDKADGVYTLGDTVTLTANDAQAGFAFSHFTVNGKAIEGNTFTVDESVISVVAVYEDERQIVVENKPENGAIVKITNDEYVLPTAKITDKEGNEISSLSVDITVTDVAGNNYEIVNGKITLTYKGVIDVTVTYSSAELGKEVSFTVTLQRSDSDLILDAGSTGIRTLDPSNCTVEYDTTVKHGSDEGSIKVTLNTDETVINLNKADYSDYDFLEYWACTDGDNVQTGAYWYGNLDVGKNVWTLVRINLRVKTAQTLTDGVYHLRIMGSWNSETSANHVVTGSHVWITSVRLGHYAENQVNDVNIKPTAYGYEANMEVATDKVYDGDDTRIVDKTVLKVTGTRDDGEIAFTANTIQLIGDIQGKTLYFYVYAATEPGSCMVGSHWCRNDAAKLNEWVKVSFTVDTANLGGVNSGSPFAENAAWKFIYSAASGKGVTLYFTSLYVE